MTSFIAGVTVGIVLGLLALRWWLGIKAAEERILDMLAEVAPGSMYGLDMVEQSGGKLKRGSIYVLLGRLQERGYIDSKADPDGRRRYYLLVTAKPTSTRSATK